MAEDTRHAAWHDKRVFAVRLIPADGPARDLITGFTDYLAAVDYVTEWLDRQDPECVADRRLAVVQTEGGVDSEVFSYPPPEELDRSQELIQLFGFDPTARRFLPHEREKPKLDRLAYRIARAPDPKTCLPPRAHVLPAPKPAPEQPSREPPVTHSDKTDDVTSTKPPTQTHRARRWEPGHDRGRPSWRAICNWIIATVRPCWDDRASRGCLIVAALSAWLTITLVNATFLAPLLASGTALWFLRHRKPIPDADADDWL
jgi:hypothetical protein